MQTGNEIKLDLLTDNMIMNVDVLKESANKLLQLIHEFRKVRGQKVNVQRSVDFPYTSNDQLQNEIRIISFTIAQTMNNLGIILSKCIADLFTTTYEIPLREIIETK